MLIEPDIFGNEGEQPLQKVYSCLIDLFENQVCGCSRFYYNNEGQAAMTGSRGMNIVIRIIYDYHGGSKRKFLYKLQSNGQMVSVAAQCTC